MFPPDTGTNVSSDIQKAKIPFPQISVGNSVLVSWKKNCKKNTRTTMLLPQSLGPATWIPFFNCALLRDNSSVKLRYILFFSVFFLYIYFPNFLLSYPSKISNCMCTLRKVLNLHMYLYPQYWTQYVNWISITFI